MTITRREYITLALIAIFGMVGAWLYETGFEWLANICVIPPSVHYLVTGRGGVIPPNEP